MLLNENGIRLPKNTQSVKILTHSDCDGFFSGLLLFHQLVRQGIKPERININFVQYGDYDLLDKATRKNRFQAVVSSDFSAFPKIDMEQCFNGFARALDKENDKYIYPPKSGDYQAFKKAGHLNKPANRRILIQWLERYCPNSLLLTDPVNRTVRRYYDDFINGWKNYKGQDEVIMTNLDYTSDHHSNEKGDLVPGKSGKIGADFRSDTEHLATAAAQNLMNWDDIEIISRIDSASYKNLHDVISMPTKLTGTGYKERLGILTSALVGSIIKSNPRLAAELIKRSQPSLVSVYNNALKIASLNDNELKILSLLKEQDVKWDEVNNLLGTLPKSEQKKILSDRPDNRIKPISTLDQMRAKDEKSVAKETSMKTTDFKFYGNTSVWQASNMKMQPSRYLFAFLKHEGRNPVFNIRKYAGMGMFQVSATPFLSEADKEKINLEPICVEALNEAKRQKLISDIAYEAIMKKSGGHKTIYNISGLDIISNTALSPNERNNYKYLKNFEDRRKALVNKEVKKALNTKSNMLKELEGKKTSAKQDVFDFLEKYIVRELNDKYDNIKPKPTHELEVK